LRNLLIFFSAKLFDAASSRFASRPYPPGTSSIVFRVLACLGTGHDWRLIAVAGAVCFLSSFAAIDMARRAGAACGRMRALWVATASIAFGSGIWATLFISMLACDPGGVGGDGLALAAPWSSAMALAVVAAVLSTLSICAIAGILARRGRRTILARERSYRILVQGVTDYAIFMLDAQGRITSWNAGAERAKGYTAAEIVGRHLSCFFSEEDRGAGVPERALATAVRDGRFEGECWHLRKDESRFLAHVIIDPIRDEGNVVSGFATVTRDITRQKEDAERTAHMARYDLLTGIANRTLFMEKLAEAAARLRRRGEPFTVLVLDLDRFKTVNDSLGHPAGDALLKLTAQRLKASLRETDVLGRIGGDEFAIIQPGGPNQQNAAVRLANRIIDIIAQPFDLDGNQVTIGTSIGIALAPGDADDPAELMKKADIALYRIKSEGRDDYRFFDAEMTASAEARRQLEDDLRGALSRDELEIHYQPILDALTGEPHAVEALARWRHPAKGYIPPSQFISLAEETGLMVPLGEWILQKACADAMNWPPHIKVAVNLSPVQLRKSNLLDVILCVLVETGLPAQRLELEITETGLFASKTDRLVMMRKLKNLGVTFALDDFGTGHSSLSYLTMFPFDKIKIDKSFTQNLTKRADCAAIVSSVLALGAGLGIKTVAEGVETRRQFDLLRAAGVSLVQGYLFCHPCAASALDFERIFTGREIEDAA
jgi:diguanylate cyclase (GGDEF)-like protein/PAS domain S-box-containing protein